MTDINKIIEELEEEGQVKVSYVKLRS